MNLFGYRKLIGLIASLVACLISPTACPSIAIIAVAFFGAHSVQEWVEGKKGSKENGAEA